METAILQDVLTELLGEIQELRANQMVLGQALGKKLGPTILPDDAELLKTMNLHKVKHELDDIRKQIARLSDE